ncbi:hypothetical protein LTR28_012055 [Elasticomyces elasticus]|nr:hypothetical protein LTR28_012055 [Elasticomyces elasticus]
MYDMFMNRAQLLRPATWLVVRWRLATLNCFNCSTSLKQSELAAKWAKALTLTPVKRLKRNLLRRAYMESDATANGQFAQLGRSPSAISLDILDTQQQLMRHRHHLPRPTPGPTNQSTAIRHRASETADPTTCISPQSRLARYRLASAKPRKTLGPSLAISFPSTLYPVSVVGKRETHELGAAAAVVAAAAVGCDLVFSLANAVEVEGIITGGLCFWSCKSFKVYS